MGQGFLAWIEQADLNDMIIADGVPFRLRVAEVTREITLNEAGEREARDFG